MTRLEFSEWPFKENEPAVLYWLRSPVMVDTGRQWTMRAVFKGSDGLLQAVKCPWGMLPFLRLGSKYVNGSMVQHHALGPIFTITLGSNVTAVTEEARKALRKREYELNDWHDFRERCLVLFSSGLRIVVPCLEVMRSFFVWNRYLAYEILKPTSFSDSISAELTGDRAKLYFQKHYLYRSLTPEVKKIIAQVILDASWFNSWKHVWNDRYRRFISDMKDKNYIPLDCIPPIYQECKWKVRGNRIGNTIFVYELIGFASQRVYPFSEIECWYYVHDNIKSNNSNSGGPVIEAAEKLRVDQSSAGPRQPSRAFLIPMDGPEHIYKSNPRLHNVPVEKSLDKKFGDFGVLKKTKKGETVTVSLNEEAATAALPSAEFIPITKADNIPSEFTKFFQAIDEMRKIQPGLLVDYEINSLPDCCPVIKRSREAQYALVSLTWQGETVHFLEVGLIEVKVSTAIFKINDKVSLNELVALFFTNGMTKSGFWDMRLLESYRVVLARHTASSAQHWGKRLLDKVMKISMLQS